MLSAVSRPRRAFELARLGKRSGIIARLEELVVVFHEGLEIILGQARPRAVINSSICRRPA
jgi:hypothetical protein